MNFYRLPDGQNKSGFWVWVLILGILISTVGLGWLIKSLVVIILFLVITPIFGVLCFQWWLRSRIVTAECPVCLEISTAFRESQFACPSCGEALTIQKDLFIRLTPPGTIDVEVQTID